MDIRVYNRFLDLQFEISRYQSLQFKRSSHGIGDFELHINRYSHGATHLDKGHLISLGKQQNKVGIILSKEIVLDEKGKESENMKFVGMSLDALMLRRITVPPTHTSHDRVSGSAEFVMKHYVYNNFINTESHRVLPNFEIADNQSRGNHISYESRYKVVADELEGISVETGLGWGVTADFKAKKFIFDVYESEDLTPDNRQGNNPVFFSPEYESIESQSFVDNDLDLRNVGYVGGQGEGAERKVVTVGDVSGWDRIETFVDARDVSNEDEETEEELPDEEVEKLLIERGKKKMKDMQTVFSLEAKISTPITRKSYEDNHEGYRHPAQPVQGQTVKKEVITPFEYEKDFDLGDRVEVRNLSWNLTMEAPITELIEIYEGDGFKLEATFGRSRPTLISKLKDKFDELEGIEKQEAPEQVSVRRMNEAKEFAKKEDVYVREDAKGYAGNAQKAAEEEAQRRAEQALKDAKAFAENADNISEGVIDVGAIPLRTSATGARLEWDGINGLVQYDSAGNAVAWLDLDANAHFANAFLSGRVEANEGYFSDNLRIRDGKMEIVRPDGAISMSDGMVRESPAISGIDPMFMDNSRQKDSDLRQEAFSPWAGYYENRVSHLDGRDDFSVDIRNSDYRSSVRIQRYYFVHTARYFVLTYRSVEGAGTILNGNLHRHLALIYDSSDNKLVDHNVPEGTSETVELIADLGEPDFKSKWLDFRIGWSAAWGSKDDYIRFRINNVVQTDFI